MPRRRRCLLPGVACHITQRGVDRRETFSSAEDRYTYLGLLRQSLEDTEVRILAYCLMSNHLHLVAVPAREDSMSILIWRVHSRRSVGHGMVAQERAQGMARVAESSRRGRKSKESGRASRYDRQSPGMHVRGASFRRAGISGGHGGAFWTALESRPAGTLVETDSGRK